MNKTAKSIEDVIEVYCNIMKNETHPTDPCSLDIAEIILKLSHAAVALKE